MLLYGVTGQLPSDLRHVSKSALHMGNEKVAHTGLLALNTTFFLKWPGLPHLILYTKCTMDGPQVLS